MPSAEPVIRLERAQLGYAGSALLRDVDLRIERGSYWFILGPNGSGKTTLLRSILGLLAPLGGTVWRHPEEATLARCGFVPQRVELSRALPTTVREFVSLGAIGSYRRRADRDADLEWALGRAGLEGLAERSYWALSGGQRQRALVARALVRRPRLLVLDEATEGLDTLAEESLLETLDALHRAGDATLLFVTHRFRLARAHATDVAVVGGGGVATGARDEMLDGPELARVFERGRASRDTAGLGGAT